ncbi:MAG TPA: amino acid ABC transporter permease [Erysipelothrix sp.]|nr:amino acid ABC transporter permease [Erysipelothrix sp.]
MDLLISTYNLFLKYHEVFLEGLIATLKTASLVVIVGTLLGSILALLKYVKFKPLNLLLSFYIELIRGTPLLLQLYFFYLALPIILNMELSTAFCIITALIVNSSAYVAEIFRAGIQAVDQGQFEAASSLGMSSFNMMTRIILPQAIKNILPALGNEFVMMIKETSLSSTFFMSDIMTSFQIVSSNSYLTIESLIIVGLIYFTLTTIFSRGISFLEKRLSHNEL